MAYACFIPEHGGPQPALPLHASARSRSSLPRLLRSPQGRKRSAAAERADSRLAGKRAAQAGDQAGRQGRHQGRRYGCGQAGSQGSRQVGGWPPEWHEKKDVVDGLVKLRGFRRTASLHRTVRSRLSPSESDAPEVLGTALIRAACRR